MPNMRVGLPVKKRLEQLQKTAIQRTDRMVTLSEVVESLLDEHDRNAREEAGA